MKTVYPDALIDCVGEVPGVAISLRRIDKPGYPDPSGPNLNRTGSSPLVPSATRYGADMQTPYTAQATLGIQRELGPRTVLTVDGVWARGCHLVAAHDLTTGIWTTRSAAGRIRTFR